MRAFSLFFAFISFVLFIQLVAYLIIGPVQTVFVVALLVGFAACAGAALYLFKPYDREALERRRKEWRERRGLDESGKRRREENEEPRDRGS